jgi:type II secretory pathway pseudopilin PulG
MEGRALRSRTHRRNAGSVLLEVILALALFVGAATIISSGINASMRSVERLRLQNHAVNLAISVLSEMQMRARPVAAIGPEVFAPPFQDWTLKVEVAQSEESIEGPEALRPVEIIVKHTQENVVQRLTQLFPVSQLSEAETAIPETP